MNFINAKRQFQNIPELIISFMKALLASTEKQ